MDDLLNLGKMNTFIFLVDDLKNRCVRMNGLSTNVGRTQEVRWIDLYLSLFIWLVFFRRTQEYFTNMTVVNIMLGGNPRPCANGCQLFLLTVLHWAFFLDFCGRILATRKFQKSVAQENIHIVCFSWKSVFRHPSFLSVRMTCQTGINICEFLVTRGVLSYDNPDTSIPLAPGSLKMDEDRWREHCQRNILQSEWASEANSLPGNTGIAGEQNKTHNNDCKNCHE